MWREYGLHCAGPDSWSGQRVVFGGWRPHPNRTACLAAIRRQIVRRRSRLPGSESPPCRPRRSKPPGTCRGTGLPMAAGDCPISGPQAWYAAAGPRCRHRDVSRGLHRLVRHRGCRCGTLRGDARPVVPGQAESKIDGEWAGGSARRSASGAGLCVGACLSQAAVWRVTSWGMEIRALPVSWGSEQPRI